MFQRGHGSTTAAPPSPPPPQPPPPPSPVWVDRKPDALPDLEALKKQCGVKERQCKTLAGQTSGKAVEETVEEKVVNAVEKTAVKGSGQTGFKDKPLAGEGQRQYIKRQWQRHYSVKNGGKQTQGQRQAIGQMCVFAVPDRDEPSSRVPEPEVALVVRRLDPPPTVACSGGGQAAGKGGALERILAGAVTGVDGRAQNKQTRGPQGKCEAKAMNGQGNAVVSSSPRSPAECMSATISRSTAAARCVSTTTRGDQGHFRRFAAHLTTIRGDSRPFCVGRKSTFAAWTVMQ